MFYNLGRLVGPKVRKGQWVWNSLTGSEEDRIKSERRVGADLANAIQAQLTSVDADDLTLVQQLGDKLAKRLTNKQLKFDFGLIPDGPPNAFALPGGFIFVNQSLLELCHHNRNEIAFILGHEIAHVVKGHAIERMINESALSVAAIASPARGLLGKWIKKAGYSFFSSGYSQDREFEADQFGTRLAVASGFDPTAACQMLKRLALLTKDQPQLPLGEYFSTHPPTEQRIAAIRKLIKSR